MNEESIFAEAFEKAPGAERQRYLDEACGANAELRRHIEDLLSAAENESGMLDHITAAVELGKGTHSRETGASPSVAVGALIAGRYRILERIGEGGMGEVFVAEQIEPVRRKVALKLIKPGFDSRAVLARFEKERQALAIMDHPHIAKIFDGGVTELGRPYFVMEYLKGSPITEYCDSVRMPIRERLQLFRSACDAVQHAHQKGVIHRDLKPSNILVALYDDKPVVKVIDFGLAKSVEGVGEDQTHATGHAMVVGTPLYMSPEQAQQNNLDIDTRSDVYALGVILYELLTGSTPIERERFKRTAWNEAMRLIREVDPPTPSTRISSTEALPNVAAMRQLEPARLSKLVRGELDWIVMKSLEKERNRRYESASALEKDIANYLEGEAVAASPPSRVYRFRKFARRNKVAMGTAALVFVSLSAGLAVAGYGLYQANAAASRERLAKIDAQEKQKDAETQKVRAEAREKEARERTQAFQAVTEFMENLFGAGDPYRNSDPNQTVKQAIALAKIQSEEKFKKSPMAHAVVQAMLGRLSASWGELEDSERYLVNACSLYQQTLGDEDPVTLKARRALAITYQKNGHLDEAEALLSEVAEIQRRLPGSNRAELASTINTLGWVRSLQKKYGPAKSDLEEARELTRSTQDRELESAVLNNLALLYQEQDLHEEALTILLDLQERQVELYGESHIRSIIARTNLGQQYFHLGKLREARKQLEIALTNSDKLFGEENLQSSTIYNSLGKIYSAMGETKKAERHLQRAVEITRRVLPTDHYDALVNVADLAIYYHSQGRVDEAEQLCNEVLDQAGVKERLDQGPISIMDVLGMIYSQTGRIDEAIKITDALLTRKVKLFGELHERTLDDAFALADLSLRSGKVADAAKIMDTWLPKAEKSRDVTSTALGVGFYVAGKISKQNGKTSEAIERFRNAVRYLDKSKDRDALMPLTGSLALLGELLISEGSYSLARKELERCVQIRTETEPESWRAFSAKSLLGAALVGEKDTASAEPLLLAAFEGLKARQSQAPPEIRTQALFNAANRLAVLYDSMGKSAEAEKWRTEAQSHLSNEEAAPKTP